MNRNKEESTDPSGKIHILQPLRDLESNWGVDVAKNLEDYLLKICSGEINGDNYSHSSVNFAEAALMVQGSVQVYSRKVEYLYSLVLNALEFLSQKSQPEQPDNLSSQLEEGGDSAAPDEEDDFWVSDDIPVDPKNTLDDATSRAGTLDYFVKPPTELLVLEGDCLDAGGDGGELDSYLLATTDLYRDFLLLDPCYASEVDNFFKEDCETVKKQNDGSRCNSMPSKSRKSILSPARQGGSSLKSRNANLHKSPCLDHGFEFNDADNVSRATACNVPENDNTAFDMDVGYTGSDLDDSDDDDDPWKPLNPHEPGNLKIKPFKKVKARGWDGSKSNRRIPIAKEFPPAKLHGTISSDLTQMWESQHRASESQQPQSPPLYEKLRQSLVRGDHGNLDEFKPQDEDVENGYDSENDDFGPPEVDMPESTYMNEDHNDDTAHFDTDKAYDYSHPTPDANLEDLCRSHMDSLLANMTETENQTEIAARVSTWKQRIEQNLEEQEALPPFDIHEYGEKVLEVLSLGTEGKDVMSFADVVKGQEKHDVARTFSALLQLVNNGNVDLQRLDASNVDNERTCYTAKRPFYIRLRRHAKRRQEVQLRSSKKRAKSQENDVETQGGRSESEKWNTKPSNSLPLTLETKGKSSSKLGKVGLARGNLESNGKRRSKFV